MILDPISVKPARKLSNEFWVPEVNKLRSTILKSIKPRWTGCWPIAVVDEHYIQVVRVAGFFEERLIFGGPKEVKRTFQLPPNV
jgi:hypothetical protein